MEMLPTKCHANSSHSLGGDRKSLFCALRDIAKKRLSANGLRLISSDSDGLKELVDIRVSNLRCRPWELLAKTRFT